MKRFDSQPHYLHRPVQWERAAVAKTLCLAALCSHLLVDEWGALLGELCSPFVSPSFHPSATHLLQSHAVHQN